MKERTWKNMNSSYLKVIQEQKSVVAYNQKEAFEKQTKMSGKWQLLCPVIDR